MLSALHNAPCAMRTTDLYPVLGHTMIAQRANPTIIHFIVFIADITVLAVFFTCFAGLVFDDTVQAIFSCIACCLYDCLHGSPHVASCGYAHGHARAPSVCFHPADLVSSEHPANQQSCVIKAWAAAHHLLSQHAQQLNSPPHRKTSIAGSCDTCSLLCKRPAA